MCGFYNLYEKRTSLIKINFTISVNWHRFKELKSLQLAGNLLFVHSKVTPPLPSLSQGVSKARGCSEAFWNGCVQLTSPEVGRLIRWPLQSRTLAQRMKNDVLERLTQGGCLLLDPEGSTTLFFMSLPAKKSWRTTAWGALLSTGFGAWLGPLGENKAVNEVRRMYARFIFTLRHIFILIRVLLTLWVQDVNLSQIRESLSSWKGMCPCQRRTEITLNYNTFSNSFFKQESKTNGNSLTFFLFLPVPIFPWRSGFDLFTSEG